MNKDTPSESEHTDRISELRTTLIRLNEALEDCLGRLNCWENVVVDRLVRGELSLDAKRVDGYKLADRILNRSLKMNVRIHQRNLLYFSIRRRQLRRDLAAYGVDPDEVEREWLASRREDASTEVDGAEAAPV